VGATAVAARALRRRQRRGRRHAPRYVATRAAAGAGRGGGFERATAASRWRRRRSPFSLPWTKTNEIHVPVDVPVDVLADVPADGGAPAEGATAPAAVSA